MTHKPEPKRPAVRFEVFYEGDGLWRVEAKLSDDASPLIVFTGREASALAWRRSEGPKWAARNEYDLEA